MKICRGYQIIQGVLLTILMRQYNVMYVEPYLSVELRE